MKAHMDRQELALTSHGGGGGFWVFLATMGFIIYFFSVHGL
jgi:hypothetical protein